MAKVLARIAGPALATMVVLAGLSAASHAHGLQLFVATEGSEVSGYVSYRGGLRAAGATIRVSDTAGGIVYSAVTGDDGTFRFEAEARVDHVITADLGDGHRAQITVAAEQLPASLAASLAASPAASLADGQDAAPDRFAGDRVEVAAAHRAAPFLAQVEAVVEAAVARQVIPLRQQVAAYEAEMRWRDVLGGLGYIVGLTGVAAWLLARRRDRQP